MIYTKMTMDAMQLCFAAHVEQDDQCLVPYVFHPFHVAEQMDDEISTTVALLHDVLEDCTFYSSEDLRKEYPGEVAEAVILLTRDRSMTYDEYIKDLSKNPIARKVKIADLMHNIDPGRRFHGDERFRERYADALAYLIEVENEKRDKGNEDPAGC